MAKKPDSQIHSTIKGKNNQIISDGVLIQGSVSVEINGSNNRIVIGPKCQVGNLKFVVAGDNNQFELGQSSKLHGSVSMTNGSRIHLGERSTFGSVELIAFGTSIDIGVDCMFSFGIVVRCSDSHPIFDISTRQRINQARDIVVEDYVWVGKKATILKGVRIATGSIVGLGSIVTKDVPPFCSVAGIPARVVRENVVWTRFTKNENLEEDQVAMGYLKKHGRIDQ